MYSVTKNAVSEAEEAIVEPSTTGTAEFTVTGGVATDPKLKLTIIKEGGTTKYCFKIENLPYSTDEEGRYTYYVQETNTKLDGYLDPTYTNTRAPNLLDKAYDEGTIINQQEGGFELPSTGGPGTRMIYLLGSMFLATAIILLGRKRIRA